MLTGRQGNALIQKSQLISFFGMNAEHQTENSEMLAVVDEKDRVIGARRRDEIHHLGLRHRAIHVLVFNSNGLLFIQKRGFHKDNNPGLWDSSVAGHVDAGETYDECCIREVEEEIGIGLIAVPERLFKIDACPETGMEFSWIYRLVTNQSLIPNYSEMEIGEWVDMLTVGRMLANQSSKFAETFDLIWQRYRSLPCKETNDN
jgi:isopentenyldiphosphate isomerase